jgi:hypothetical protein
LPDKVIKTKHDQRCSHAFCEIKNEQGEWIVVDPTWNKELKQAGFPISAWDGKHSTKLAIECDKVLSPEESIKYIDDFDCIDDILKNGNFYEAINRYCDSFLK